MLCQALCRLGSSEAGVQRVQWEAVCRLGKRAGGAPKVQWQAQCCSGSKTAGMSLMRWPLVRRKGTVAANSPGSAPLVVAVHPGGIVTRPNERCKGTSCRNASGLGPTNARAQEFVCLRCRRQTHLSNPWSLVPSFSPHPVIGPTSIDTGCHTHLRGRKPTWVRVTLAACAVGKQGGNVWLEENMDI